MTNRFLDEEHILSARAPFALALVVQAVLFLVLLSWASAAQESVPASAASPKPRVPLAMPHAVSSFGAAELDGWLYLLGGHGGRTHRYSQENQWDGFVRMRADDLSVREELPGGQGLQGTALVASGGRLVRIGGMRASGSGEEVELASVASVSAFDPATRAWSELPSLPVPRSSHDAAAIGTRVFVFGGWNLAGDSDEAAWASEGLVLDLSDLAAGWRTLEQPFVQRGAAVAASSREVFVLGGMDAEGDFNNAVDVFDPGTGAWRKAPPFPGEGFGLTAVVVGNRLFASGREGGVFALTLGSMGSPGERWERCGELFVPRLFHRILPAGDGLVVLGGASASRPVGWIERVQPDEPEHAALFTLPFAGRARQRQALFAHESTLYLFGGNFALEQHAFEPEDFLAEAWRFELGSGSSAALPPLLSPRQSMVCVEAPGRKSVFALGGFGHDGKTDRTFDEVWCCELESGSWSALDVRLPLAMTQFRALVRGEELLLVGGMNFDRERTPKMRLLDTVYTARVARIEDGFRDSGLRLPSPRRAFGAALLDGKLYLSGGLDESFEAVERFDVYDFTAQAWSSLPAPRHGPAYRPSSSPSGAGCTSAPASCSMRRAAPCRPSSSRNSTLHAARGARSPRGSRSIRTRSRLSPGTTSWPSSRLGTSAASLSSLCSIHATSPRCSEQVVTTCHDGGALRPSLAFPS